MHHRRYRPVHRCCHQQPRPGVLSGCYRGQKWVLSGASMYFMEFEPTTWQHVLLFQGSSRRKPPVRTHGCPSLVSRTYKVTAAVGLIWHPPSPIPCFSWFFQLACFPRSITRKSMLLLWKSLARCSPLRESLPVWLLQWPWSPTWPTCNPRPSGTETVLTKKYFMTVITLQMLIIHVLPAPATSRPRLTDAPSQWQLWKITMLWKLFSLIINSS